MVWPDTYQAEIDMALNPGIIVSITGSVTPPAVSKLLQKALNAPYTFEDYIQIENAHEDIEAYETTRYRCPHCRKSWAKRDACYHHILHGCHMDARTATCATCRFLGDDHEYYGDQHCAMNVGRFTTRKAERPKNCPLWQAKGRI